ncbi:MULTISPECIES: sugar transferase [Moorena]|uniref:Exopolysaccharide biosynthesis polyprenyl glycosylphosphotransferase n=1 Tax=Moorena producens 3L TaxID=489825 RepID=F4Y1L2_9CYAN|nr:MULTISPECIES: sugar transferase [Moorena]EGJ29154.1 exopolysaccharide biosynthesis polyprenyl glycosylphosphotransferase [Moorena producens 3L]NEP32133.1 sugar transferase [Moorena sp. SIO3B2]NEP69383.1 sugar transferase [Moorena sp. SIO3A5]NEQ06201.1 sugar transferase [Moorena sp. SIO4E2]NER91419.1 sugar transferase [Moorena sp. SIO3A2]
MELPLTETYRFDIRDPVFAKLRRNTYAVWLRIVTLVVTDVFMLLMACLIAVNFGNHINNDWGIVNQAILVYVVIPWEILLLALQDLYNSGNKRRDYLALAQTITFSQISLLVIACLYQPDQFVIQPIYSLLWLLSLALVCIGRLGIDFILKRLRKKGLLRYPTLIICSPDQQQKAIQLLGNEDCYGIIKFFDVNLLDKSNISDFIKEISALEVAEVFVCSWNKVKDYMFFYWSLRNAGITLRILCTELGPIYQNLEMSSIASVPTIRFSPPLITGIDFWAKRCFDFVLSVLVMIVLLPLFVSISVLVKLDSPGPIFYKQERVGLHNKRFKAWKFRSMFVDADQRLKDLEARNEMKDGVLFKIKDDPRITKVGKFIRRYSLDELPQLFNVLFGEMSLVGPRPLPIRDVNKFSEQHFIRHAVLPGITGLWQVSGRSDITSFEEVVRLDTFYMENWSLWLDLKILVKTAIVLLQKKGAY